MKTPLHMDGQTVRDADGCVVISALNPCNMAERKTIVEAVNAQAMLAKQKDPLRNQPFGTAKPFDEEEFNREVSKPNGWSEVKDPVAEIRRMRGDPDYTGFNKMLNALKTVMKYSYIDCSGKKRCCLGPDEVAEVEAALAEAEAD